MSSQTLQIPGRKKSVTEIVEHWEEVPKKLERVS